MSYFGMPVGEMPDDEDMKKPLDAASVFSNFTNNRPKQNTTAPRHAAGSKPVIVEVRKSRKFVKPT